MSTINILCPNGRRQQIRVEPNTKIIQIIEQVCQKLGLNSDEYDLIHQRRRLDVTITFRLSGISNNASLELKKLEEPRQLTDVVIILQLDDGTRLKQQTFKPNESLLKVIDVFQSNADGILETSMNENYQPICSYLNEELIGRFQLENTTLKEFGLTSGRAILRFSYRIVDKDHFDKINKNFKEKLDKKKQLEEKTNKAKEIVKMESENKSEETQISSPVLDKSMYPKRQKNDEKSSSISSINDKQALVDEEKNAAFSEIPQLNNEFLNFKFPEETKGEDSNNYNELAEIEYNSKQPCPRQELVFLARNYSSEATSLTELRDDFYDVTINDLRFMMSELERKASEEKLLMTKAMRELEQDKKAMKYENIAIRIKFNNNEYVLQGLFKPKEPDTSPPKTILSDKKKTLFDYKLYPAAIIYFGDKSESNPILNENLIKNIKSAEEADEIVQKNVHHKIRNINHEGIEWLEKENRIAQSVLTSSGIMKTSNNSFVNQELKNTQNSQRITKMNDSNREKFERFLKGSKK